MKTNAENQAQFKARMRESGYIRVDVWIPKHRKPDLKRFVAKLMDRKETLDKEFDKEMQQLKQLERNNDK